MHTKFSCFFFRVFSAYTAVQDVRKKKQIIIEKIVKEEKKNKSSNSSYVLRLHCMRGNWFCFSEEIGKDFYIIFIGEAKVDLLASSVAVFYAGIFLLFFL